MATYNKECKTVINKKLILSLLPLMGLTTLILLGCSDKDFSLRNESTTRSSDSFDHCAQVLSKGIYNSDTFNEDLQSKEYLVSNVCTVLDTYSGSNDERWEKDCGSSSGGSSAGLDIDAVIKAVPVGLGASYANSNSNQWCQDAGTRKAYRNAWYQSMCSNNSHNSYIVKNSYHVMTKINPGVVDAWSQCVTQKYDGLSCAGKRAGMEST